MCPWLMLVARKISNNSSSREDRAAGLQLTKIKVSFILAEGESYVSSNMSVNRRFPEKGLLSLVSQQRQAILYFYSSLISSILSVQANLPLLSSIKMFVLMHDASACCDLIFPRDKNGIVTMVWHRN